MSLLKTLKQLVETWFSIEIRRARKAPYFIDLEKDLVRLLKLDNGNGLLILDVGANEGQSAAKYSALFPSATIHCFEPGVAYKMLVESFKSNVQVKPVQIAISDSVGSCQFHHGSDSLVSSILNPEAIERQGFESTTVVATTTLDDYCKQNSISQIDLLKIDVQGAELRVLLGAKSLLQNQRISVIVAEVWFSRFYENQACFHDIVSFMSECGYHLFSLYNFASRTPHVGVEWCDAAFLKQNSKANGLAGLHRKSGDVRPPLEPVPKVGTGGGH